MEQNRHDRQSPDRIVDPHIPDNAELGELSETVGRVLLAGDAACATAESCTGGMVAKLLTDIPGSSAWFPGGFVCYSNASKHTMLGVPEQLIESVGAVSQEVVNALSSGAIARTGAEFAVAISGVAGPDGGSAEKPVGTVWIGWAASVDQVAITRQYLFSGSRDEVRRAAAGRALRGILEIEAHVKEIRSSS